MQKICLLSAFLLICISLTYAQNPLERSYTYDESGNRTKSKIIDFGTKSMQVSIDSLNLENTETESSNPMEEDVFYTEQVGNIQLHIFPNPTTQRVTVRIENYADFKGGVLQLCATNGQLLQQIPVYSSEFTIDLSHYVKGIYILKLQINQQNDSWKIIKE